MKKTLGIAACFGLSLLLGGCSQGITEPLSSSELRALSTSVDKPKSFTKLSPKSYSDFEESYGDQERIDPTFDNTSEECSAVADLQRVTRWAQGGNDFRKFMPSSLRGFSDIDGLKWSVETSDDADVYSYAKVEVALLAFDDEESALSYSSEISENVEDCFDFREEENDVLIAQDLSKFSLSEEHAPDYTYTYTYYFESSGYFEISISTDYAVSVMHFGPNLAIAIASSDSDSRAELGISTSDLEEGFDELRQLIELAIEEVQESGAANALGG